jgi:hypothetical protein
MGIVNRWLFARGGACMLWVAGVATVGAMLAGCGGSAASLDRKDRSDPLMRRAEARAKEGDTESAIRLYVAAIDSNPKLALAHLQLALLYHDQRKDYVLAIYHYRRYHQLRGDTEKSQMIKDRIRMAGQMFAASLNRGDSRSMEKMELEKENADLKKMVERANADMEALRQKYEKLVAAVRLQMDKSDAIGVPKAPVPDALPGGATVLPEAVRIPTEPVPAPAARRQVRTYRVQSGDSLISIAGQVYGDSSRWQQIHVANRRLLGTSASLKVGQVLVIP